MASSNDSVYARDNSIHHRVRFFTESPGKRKKQKTDQSLALPSETATNEENGPKIDLISCLPDCVLSTIISCLPIKDAARTTVLSSRWRHLWAFAPLNFDSDYLSAGGTRPPCSMYSCALKDVIYEVLKMHHGPVRQFCLAHVCFGGSEICLKEWMEDLSKRFVQEITLKFDPPCNQLTTSLLMCKSLQSLKLHGSWFPSTSENNPCFTSLIELTLSNTIISGKDLQSVLSCCQALQRLSLIDLPFNNPDVVREIEICSGSLKSVIVTDCPLRKICIENAPNLEQLMLGTGMPVGTWIKVVHAPKMRVLGYLEIGSNKFEMGCTLLKESHLSLSTLIYSVKNLAISVNFDSFSQATTAVSFLRCFPLLETLHIGFLFLFRPKESPDLQDWSYQEPINCLDSHLKSVTFQAYVGARGSIELDFAKFILSRAKVLKVFKVVPRWNQWTDKMQNDLVCMIDEVSSDAQVILVTKRSSRGYFSADATNLSVHNPFD